MDKRNNRFGLGLLLSLSLACAVLPAAAANKAQPHVIDLGTIHVTRADAERGSPVYLGRIQVTPADSLDARAAALQARRSGSFFLGTVTVTAADSVDARLAAADAQQKGSMFLGTVVVRPQGVTQRLLADLHRVGTYVVSAGVALLGTLAFAKAWG